ncbi:hypothetical protein PoB_000210800 [Plakobranchus ocellatus]|uniref:Uncharacterized protein n=1 Tax=Plakobranchus ocellatus TaxID=259542 RepID=A0AAV3XZ14_9GAST|nr:hypothetical protein PoB_000210800 [Plakobranchus ocellatus]
MLSSRLIFYLPLLSPCPVPCRNVLLSYDVLSTHLLSASPSPSMSCALQECLGKLWCCPLSSSSVCLFLSSLLALCLAGMCWEALMLSSQLILCLPLPSPSLPCASQECLDEL